VIDEHGWLDGPQDEHVQFRSTGDEVQGAFRCTGCGYGVALAQMLPRCPMCGGEDWEDERASALVRARSDPWPT